MAEKLDERVGKLEARVKALEDREAQRLSEAEAAAQIMAEANEFIERGDILGYVEALKRLGAKKPTDGPVENSNAEGG